MQKLYMWRFLCFSGCFCLIIHSLWLAMDWRRTHCATRRIATRGVLKFKEGHGILLLDLIKQSALADRVTCQSRLQAEHAHIVLMSACIRMRRQNWPTQKSRYHRPLYGNSEVAWAQTLLVTSSGYRSMNCCDQSVCPSARISKNRCPNFTPGFSMHVTCGHSSFLFWRHCYILRTSGFVNDVT